MQFNYANQPFSQYLHRSSALSTNKAVDWLASKRMFHLLWRIHTIIGQSDHLKMLDIFLFILQIFLKFSHLLIALIYYPKTKNSLKIIFLSINMANWWFDLSYTS